MKYIFILIFSSFSLSLIGQTIAEGETFFNSGQYESARQTYKALLDKKPYHALNNYKYARCCYKLNLKEEAIVHFRLSDSKMTPLCNYYLGELYFDTYQFDNSVDTYKTYLATLNKEDDKEKIDEINKKIKKAQIAAELIKRVEEIVIIDSIVVNKNNFLMYYKIPSTLGALGLESIISDNRKQIDKVSHQNQRINKFHFSDNNNGQMDIYYSYKLFGTWLNPILKNKEINTPANENYPFLMSDDITLLYASDGDMSIGGYDIFIAKYDSSKNSYLIPENIGMPFNSPYNDYMMVIDEQNEVGWFASDRYQPEDKVMIYKFKFNEERKFVPEGDNDYIRAAAQLRPNKQLSNTIQQTTEEDTIAPIEIEEEIIAQADTTEIIEEVIIRLPIIAETIEEDTIAPIEISEEIIAQADTTEIIEEVIIRLPIITETTEEDTIAPIEIEEEIETQQVAKVDIDRLYDRNQIDFFISDTIHYTHVSQFKSSKALRLYLELSSLIKNNNLMRKELSFLKSQYIDAKTDNEQDKLLLQIAFMEKSVREQEEYINEKTIEIRYEEIKYLRIYKP